MRIVIESSMFKITQNTLRNFTLAEVLLMAAMDESSRPRRSAVMGDTCLTIMLCEPTRHRSAGPRAAQLQSIL